MKKVVIALGGNAILSDDPSAEAQEKTLDGTAKKIKDFIDNSKEEIQVIITHGNGPQVGNLLLQQLNSNSKDNPAMPLDTDGAMTQGEIGYWLQNSLGNQGQSAVTIITRALVDANDSAFQNPSKPIGPFYKDKDELKKNHPDWNIVEDSGRGYRRVVPSPKPISILEAKQINDLVNNGQTIIAGGGGGIPVVKDQNGNFAGVEAVIDKDFTAAKIAELVDADELIILTAVDQAAINFNTPNQKNIGRININDLNLYLNQGQFGKGSMEPKIRASISFAEKTGKEAIITSLDNVSQFEKNGKATIIYK